MLKKLILALVLLEFVLSWSWHELFSKKENDQKQFKATRKFVFKNQCDQKIWIGAFGVPLLTRTGWEMAPNSQ